MKKRVSDFLDGSRGKGSLGHDRVMFVMIGFSCISGNGVIMKYDFARESKLGAQSIIFFKKPCGGRPLFYVKSYFIA